MRVLMFGWEFPPHISGGLGTACYGLTQAMMSQGMKVLFVVPKAFGDELETGSTIISADQIPIQKMPLTRDESWQKILVGSQLTPYVTPKQFEEKFNSHSTEKRKERIKFSGSYTKYLYKEIAQYAEVAKKIAKNNEFDVIHAHDWLTFKAGIAAKEISGKPLVVHVHATEFDRSSSKKNEQVYALEREGMMLSDKVVTVSNFTSQIVQKHYGIPREKIVTIHNGVNWASLHQKINTKSEKKTVTFLGRVTSQKGPAFFIEAASIILKWDSSFEFVMAGSGDLLDDMMKKVADLGIERNFTFTGFLAEEQVHEIYDRSAVFVMPSVSEPFGIAPLEAIKQKVPVIISKQSGVSEVINHAIKVDYWDTKSLANAMYGLVKYPAIGQEIQRNASCEVEGLTWQRASEKLEHLYQLLV